MTYAGARRAAAAPVLLAAALAALLLAGCETVRTARAGPGQRLDPWENFNRKVFAFNESLDANLLKPVATVYVNVIPQPVRTSVTNFFGNMLDAWSAVNNVLQGKFQNAGNDLVRVSTNTFLGMFGAIDVAADMGLDHQYEDFGQTLGRWGFGAGAYLVLPVLGPSSVRDAIGIPFDRAASPALLINDGQTKIGVTIIQLINTRATLLGATNVIDDIALDKYTFIRDAYLQRRRSLVFDGDVPETPDQQGGAGPASGEGTAVEGGASAPSGGASAPAARPPGPSASAPEARPTEPSAPASGPGGAASAPQQ
jgi:phospholipid-binding lipoprotein MlaA